MALGRDQGGGFWKADPKACCRNEIIHFMNEIELEAAPGHRLPHIVTVGRYRIGRVMQSIAQSWDGVAQITHVSASFADAVRTVRALDARRPIDALVVAGASGAHVREQVEIPVAMVEVRGLGLLEALMTAKQQTTPDRPRVGLVSFDAPSPQLMQFDALFGLGVAQFVYHGAEDAAACVQQLRAANVGAVVAPGLVADLAQQAGIPSVLLYSEAAVRQALNEALLLARHRMAERDRNQWLETVLGELQDGVVAIDAQGRIRALNARMASLLGEPVEALHGRMLAEVSPVLMQGHSQNLQEGTEDVVQLAMRTLVLRRAPLMENGAVAGALLVCRDPAVIQRADRNLRANQRQRGAGVRWSIDDFQGHGACAHRIRELAHRYAASDATVLVQGESGTGKEMMAQGIHRASRRAAQPFLAVNCAALAESLLESELFGYDEGAFTGARRGGKTGLIEAAHTGTLFLDEIGDMPLALQSRLLRVLQEREVMRVGSTTPVPVDVRVIAATHADLADLVERGLFRRDLYYRLAVLRMGMPSLRERGQAESPRSRMPCWADTQGTLPIRCSHCDSSDCWTSCWPCPRATAGPAMCGSWTTGSSGCSPAAPIWTARTVRPAGSDCWRCSANARLLRGHGRRTRLPCSSRRGFATPDSRPKGIACARCWSRCKVIRSAPARSWASAGRPCGGG